jgi:PAS domain S-box-containing protein
MLLTALEPGRREAIASRMRVFGLPDSLGRAVNSVVAVPIVVSGRPVGRIHVFRFDPEAALTVEDQRTAEILAAAAALVFERRSVEGELATSLGIFTALFEQAPIGIIVVAPPEDARFNRAALELFGRTESAMRELGSSPRPPWIPDEERELYESMRADAIDGRPASGQRFSVLRPNGERRDVLRSTIPMAGSDGSTIGSISVLVDITEQESLEVQLRHAQKMEALGRLAGGIAHDFNNILLAVRGFTELMLDDARAGRVAVADVEQILGLTDRAIDLTARLTAFSRRDRTRLEPTRIDTVVAGILPLLQVLAPESVAISPVLGSTPPTLIDRAEFEQVLVNLAVNAVDAMPDGGRLTIETSTIELSAEHASTHLSSKPGPHVMVAISDTGSGMDDATRARIFEPFYTTKAVGKGTGLGLAMVFAAVQRAGGGVWVYSEVGRGTTFRIYLPVAEPVEPADESPVKAPEPPRGTESVLLVEDDPAVRTIVERMLAGLGYEVTTAALPGAAVGLVTSTHIDLLITDVVMPEMTGPALAEHIRQSTGDLPILFMSGYAASILDVALGSRMALIHKPMSRLDLAVAVRSLLDG